MTPPAILNKIKLLRKLSQSPNPHEAESATRLSEGLIKKHNISPEELESIKDAKPLYGDDEKVYTSLGIVSWRQQLVVSVANHLNCKIIQEELVPMDGPHSFNYYAYGEPEDVKNVQFVFKTFADKVERLSDTECMGRGLIYISSYCSGVVDAIKQNISLFGIELPDLKKPVRKVEVKDSSTTPEDAIKTVEKPKPADRHVDVNTDNIIKDIAAYFNGIRDGKELFLEDILEMASKNEGAEKITEIADTIKGQNEI